MSQGFGMMNATSRAWSAQKAAPFSACVNIFALKVLLAVQPERRRFHRLLRRSFFLREELTVLFAPSRSSHALPNPPSGVFGTPHMKPGCRTRSSPMRHHSFLHEVENIQQDFRR